jgi:hypothetical protein
MAGRSSVEACEAKILWLGGVNPAGKFLVDELKPPYTVGCLVTCAIFIFGNF